MSSSKYFCDIRLALKESLCLEFFPSPTVERHSVPEVEIRSKVPNVNLEDKAIVRNENECILIEMSLNSARISLKLKKIDDLDRLISRLFTSFMMRRAENFKILRRVPLKDYDISFLIVHEFIEGYKADKIQDFILVFMEEIIKEISEMKLGVNSKARSFAECLLKEFS